MKKSFSWASNLTFENKWDKLVLTSKGAFVAAWVSTQDWTTYNATVLNLDKPGPATIEGSFKSLEQAQQFADKELKKQGF